MQIAGKTVLVTGGTDGIGRQLALQLQALGADVLVTGRDKDRLARAGHEGMTAIEADLTGPAGVDAVMRGLAGRSIDVLINLAIANAPGFSNKPLLLFAAAVCLSCGYAAAIDRFVDPYFRRLRKQFHRTAATTNQR